MHSAAKVQLLVNATMYNWHQPFDTHTPSVSAMNLLFTLAVPMLPCGAAVALHSPQAGGPVHRGVWLRIQQCQLLVSRCLCSSEPLKYSVIKQYMCCVLA